MEDLTADDVREAIRKAAEPLGTISRWAKENGISPSYALDVVNGTTEPGKGVLAPLGLERVVTYRSVKS